MVLEKAWDLKGLVAELKPLGLDIAEESAKLVLDKVLLFVEESVKLSENKVDDFALSVIPLVKPYVLNAIDKIDKKVG